MKVIEIKEGVYEIESSEENKVLISIILKSKKTDSDTKILVEEWGLSIECPAWQLAEWKKLSFRLKFCPVCKDFVSPVTTSCQRSEEDVSWETVCPECDFLFDED